MDFFDMVASYEPWLEEELPSDSGPWGVSLVTQAAVQGPAGDQAPFFIEDPGIRLSVGRIDNVARSLRDSTWRTILGRCRGAAGALRAGGDAISAWPPRRRLLAGGASAAAPPPRQSARAARLVPASQIPEAQVAKGKQRQRVDLRPSKARKRPRSATPPESREPDATAPQEQPLKPAPPSHRPPPACLASRRPEEELGPPAWRTVRIKPSAKWASTRPHGRMPMRRMSSLEDKQAHDDLCRELAEACGVEPDLEENEEQAEKSEEKEEAPQRPDWQRRTLAGGPGPAVLARRVLARRHPVANEPAAPPRGAQVKGGGWAWKR